MTVFVSFLLIEKYLKIIVDSFFGTNFPFFIRNFSENKDQTVLTKTRQIQACMKIEQQLSADFSNLWG